MHSSHQVVSCHPGSVEGVFQVAQVTAMRVDFLVAVCIGVSWLRCAGTRFTLTAGMCIRMSWLRVTGTRITFTAAMCFSVSRPRITGTRFAFKAGARAMCISVSWPRITGTRFIFTGFTFAAGLCIGASWRRLAGTRFTFKTSLCIGASWQRFACTGFVFLGCNRPERKLVQEFPALTSPGGLLPGVPAFQVDDSVLELLLHALPLQVGKGVLGGLPFPHLQSLSVGTAIAGQECSEPLKVASRSITCATGGMLNEPADHDHRLAQPRRHHHGDQAHEKDGGEQNLCYPVFRTARLGRQAAAGPRQHSAPG
mmetsp:Transcript_48635/g.140920  ORF Transcript_48635/g.140920 Transcript_48635/m.140920 type:complete len:311 (+) Transcript_48635:359-1291(+)